MKIITRKPEPKFARRPNNSQLKTEPFLGLEQRGAGSSGKKLQISNNVLNLMVMGCQQNRQIELSRLLFTNQKSLPFQSARKDIHLRQNSTLSKMIFLEYSPDSILDSPFRRPNGDDSEILIEGYSQDSCKGKVFNDPATNFTFQKSDESEPFQVLAANVTPFALEDTHKTSFPRSSLTVSLISDNGSIFMVNYRFNSEARATLSEEGTLFKKESESLINRMRLCFRKSPLIMFIFFVEVLEDYENIHLRQFLMKNSIRYTTEEIVSLEGHINQALDMCKGEDLLETMFMTEEEDDMVVVNFTALQCQVEPFHTNFWQALAPIFSQKIHQKQAINFQIRKIEEFLHKLI